MGLLTPLKPIVNPKNKEYHSNWFSVIEVKKINPQASIEDILNQKEEENNDVFEQIVSTDNPNENAEKEEEKAESRNNEQK